MRKDNRKFRASISVRNGESRVKLELSPAPLHGGPEGFYRVRMARRWLNAERGEPRFFDREGLARLTAGLAVCGLDAPTPAPDIPCRSRVSVRYWKDGIPYHEGSWTITEPILDYTGRWKVCVLLNGERVFVPVEDVIVHKERGHG